MLLHFPLLLNRWPRKVSELLDLWVKRVSCGNHGQLVAGTSSGARESSGAFAVEAVEPGEGAGDVDLHHGEDGGYVVDVRVSVESSEQELGEDADGGRTCVEFVHEARRECVDAVPQCLSDRRENSYGKYQCDQWGWRVSFKIIIKVRSPFKTGH